MLRLKLINIRLKLLRSRGLNLYLMKKVPLLFGYKFGYLGTQGAFEGIELMLNVSITLSNMLFHTRILLFHALYEVGVKELQESLHVIESAFQLLDSSL